MAGTVSVNGAQIHNCDAVSTWTGSPTLDTEVYIEGTGSLSAKVSKTAATFMYPISVTDLSDTIILIWVLGSAASQFDLKANGGITFRIENGATPDYTEWYVAGSDEGYEGGWQPLTIRTTQTPDNVSASPDLTQANAVGITFTVTASAAKINCWFDAPRYGDTMTVYAGTSGAPASLADIVAAEGTNKYGFFVESEGVLFAQCKLNIGSTSAGVDTFFEEASKSLVFRDKPDFGDFFTITFQGNATGDTQIYWGENVGGRGVSGLFIDAAGTTTWALVGTDANVDNIGMFGCVLYDARAIDLPGYVLDDKEFFSNTIESCGQVDPDESAFQYASIISSDEVSGGLLLDSVSHNVVDSNFINNIAAIQITVAGAYDFDNLQFSGNVYDVNNSSGGAVTVNALNQSNVNESKCTGNTTVVSSVFLTVNVTDEDGNDLSEVQTAIYKVSDDTQLMNQDTDGTGEAKTTFNYPAVPVDIYIRLRKSSTGTRYLPFYTEGTIDSNGYTLAAILIEDNVAG